jgi:Big-like domain-containing protein/fibronectin type III domain protein
VVRCKRTVFCLFCLASVMGGVPATAAPAPAGAQVAGVFSDASGHSAQSHLVYAANSGVWWLFTLSSAADSTGGSNHIIKAFRSSSSDLATATWIPASDSPGASTTSSTNCVSCSMGGGRALGVVYLNVGGADVVHAEVAMAANGQNGLTAHIRAVVGATAIAWEAWNYHDEGAATWTLPRTVTLGVSAAGYVHSGGPTLQQEVDANARTSIHADVGPTWTSGFSNVAVIDNSMTHENNALAFAALADYRMLAVYDNGAGTEPSLTNLRYRRSNADGSWPGVDVGSQTGGDGAVFSTTATIDQNDWTLVRVTATGVFAFRRNATGTGVDAAAYVEASNGWTSFPSPPLVGSGRTLASGAGLFGATDGATVWLFAITGDAASTILFTRHDAAGWSAWAPVPDTDTGTHVRRFISGYPLAGAGQIGVLWTEGTGPYDVVTTSLAAADTVAPSVSMTAPADASTVSGTVSVSATASDNVGVAGVTFQIDGSAQGPAQTTAPYAFSWDSTTVSSGTHTIAAVAADSAGNTTTATVSVNVSNTPDATPPAIANVTVFSVTTTSALVSWSTDERATSVVDYGPTTSYGASAIDPTLVTLHTMTVSGLNPGTAYHLRVESADAAGNLSSSGDAPFSTAAADTTPPSVSITAPAGGATVAASVTVSATAADNTAVAGVQFLLDGSALGAERTSAPYAVAWNTTAAANGPHTLTARARDAAGNVATSASVAVSVVNVSAPLVDVVISADQSNSRTVRTYRFSTTSANEVLIAFVSAGDVSAGNVVTGVTGGGLTWTLVRRTNVQRGTSEIWRAFAPSTLASVYVEAQFAQQAPASLTVVGFSRVDTSGANGAGAVGATASASGSSGGPTATVVTTRNNSLVFGVGDDPSRSASRSVGQGQTLVHQFANNGRTLWVQRITNPVALSGTAATINDTSPTGDRYNLTVCEILGRVQ